jgi:4'-phosphopantetheinyl transferase
VRRLEPPDPPARSGDVATCYVWWCRIDDHRLDAARYLLPVELARANGFRRVEDRRRFALGVAVSRVATGWQLGIPAADVPLERRCPRCDAPHGRPRLPDEAGIELSVAHSGRVVVVAVRARVAGDRGTSRVGVDVEMGKPALAHRGLTESTEVLAPSEIEVVRAMAPEEQAACFLTYWVRKEAVVKATGLGLLAPLASITVSAPSERARIVHWDDDALGRVDGMALVDLPAAPGYFAALAVHGMPGLVVEADAAALLMHGRPMFA